MTDKSIERGCSFNVGQRMTLGLLRAYKLAVSPLLPSACRYVPTCSEYAAEAVERRGAVYGILLALWRVLRCHPFAAGGYDPTPNAKQSRPQNCQVVGPPICKH
ncbi:MAG: membrane protein insertion efficiency factor YidD [Acidobacteriales bacterium]|nr:membrane protein insertion efficiency factor YidD [Terriglobales bacterium]